MIQIAWGYEICVASPAYRHAYIEKLLYMKEVIPRFAQEGKDQIIFELIFAEQTFTYPQQRRLARLLALVKQGRFRWITFRGDIATPHVGALRRAVPVQTEVRNLSVENSELDFFLQLFEFERT